MQRTDSGVALVVPAYRPDARLVELLAGLRGRWGGPVLVVDDGSGERYSGVFRQCRALGAQVVSRAARGGKGEALKSGFEAAERLLPRPIGVVCADDDCRHLPADVVKVAELLSRRPEALVLGCRDFSVAGIAPTTHLANFCTRVAVRMFCGVAVSDTQSGLRGLPMDFALHMCEEEHGGFEFEAAMLAEAEREGIEFAEVSIAYTSDAGAPGSDFRPLADTARIFAVMLELFAKYALSSVFCYVLDLAIFGVLMTLLASGTVAGEATGSWGVYAATVLARVVSAGTNFAVNRRKVFGAGVSGARIARYVALSAGIMAASAIAVGWAAPATGIPAVIVKPFVDFLLFFVNYKAQQLWVFA